MTAGQHWTQQNRMITKRIVDRLNALPAPVKALIGFLPGGGTATAYAETHKWTIIELAKHYDQENKLSPEAKRALRTYLMKLEEEQKAYHALLQSIEQHV